MARRSSPEKMPEELGRFDASDHQGFDQNNANYASDYPTKRMQTSESQDSLLCSESHEEESNDCAGDRC